jgi:hypothetical protein
MAVTLLKGSWYELTSCDADYTFTNPVTVTAIVLQPSVSGDSCVIRDADGDDQPGIKIDSTYGLAFKLPKPLHFRPKYVKGSSTVTTTAEYSVLIFME